MKSVAIATLAPGGSVAVGSALVLDEVEHHRAGIGCMLESSPEDEISISTVVPGGAAELAGITEGDVIESIDGQAISG
jgi:C-terminal processing protease CtpA/Prc